MFYSSTFLFITCQFSSRLISSILRVFFLSLLCYKLRRFSGRKRDANEGLIPRLDKVLLGFSISDSTVAATESR